MASLKHLRKGDQVLVRHPQLTSRVDVVERRQTPCGEEKPNGAVIVLFSGLHFTTDGKGFGGHDFTIIQPDGMRR